jgi:hypothetical protein
MGYPQPFRGERYVVRPFALEIAAGDFAFAVASARPAHRRPRQPV